jgi:hypothetical protein
MADIIGRVDVGALEFPAIFANHVQMTKYGTTFVRLSFGEAPVSNKPSYRAAILMHLDDVRLLAQGLLQLLNMEAAKIPPGSRPN